MIVGPRRSNHYLLLAKGAPETPSVSLMASSDEVAELGDTHLSLSPANSSMAKAAADEAAARSNKSANKSYVSVVSSDCLACKDFEKHFDSHASTIGLKKAASLPIVGDQPDTTKLNEEIKKHNPAFILLPNYSIVTTHLISGIHPAFPNAFCWRRWMGQFKIRIRPKWTRSWRRNGIHRARFSPDGIWPEHF
jgi:hypothetical protein